MAAAQSVAYASANAPLSATLASVAFAAACTHSAALVAAAAHSVAVLRIP